MNFHGLLVFAILLTAPGLACPQFSHPHVPESQEENLPTELTYEKVYLHLDKGNYTLGEHLWYKAYLVDAKNNILTNHSRNLYVELVSPGLEILDKQIIRLEMGTGSGDFHLGDSLPTGTYLIRAYTSWMLNFGADFIFQREIRILNPDIPAFGTDVQSQLKQGKPDLQFFPEGGSLVAGVITRVGFKAVGVNGKGCSVNGFIANREGDTCARFESSHMGMGSFNFVPVRGTQYHALISNVDGSAHRYDLPRVFEGGYVLNVKDINQDELMVIIKTNAQMLEMQDTLPVYLEVRTAKGNYLIEMYLSYRAQSITLQKVSIPPGIIHLILYDANNKPHCERLLYLDPAPRIRLQVKSHKPVYSYREKTVLKVSVTDDSNFPVYSEMSLAAVDAVALADTAADPTHILSYLSLESELRGVVENPGYYFNEQHADRHDMMDLLLLTQGWRDFIWKYHADTAIDIHYPAEQGLTLSGRLMNSIGKKPKVDARISLAMLGENISHVSFTTTDSLGIYSFGNLDLRGSQHLIVSAEDSKGRKRGILYLDSLSRPDVEVEYIWKSTRIQPKNLEDEFIEDAITRANILKRYSLSDTIPIEEVMVKTMRRTPPDGHQRIYGEADNVVEVTDDLSHFTDIFQLIQGRVPGVMISGQYPDYHVQIRGVSNLSGISKPLLLLDGTPVDMAVMASIPVFNVDKIEVLKDISKTALFGFRGVHGVISVFTKTGHSSSYDVPLLYSINTVIRGYHDAKTFYAPRYNIPRPEHQMPDLRTTIHWEPFVQTPDTGCQEITFFNADNPATIYIIVEGITRDGIPLYSRTSYQVN